MHHPTRKKGIPKNKQNKAQININLGWSDGEVDIIPMVKGYGRPADRILPSRVRSFRAFSTSLSSIFRETLVMRASLAFFRAKMPRLSSRLQRERHSPWPTPPTCLLVHRRLYTSWSWGIEKSQTWERVGTDLQHPNDFVVTRSVQEKTSNCILCLILTSYLDLC